MKTDRDTKAKIKNFTPLLDELVKKHGVVTAAVWGRVWRYAQQENGVCQASTEKIAEELGISRRTVIRHLKALVEAGYLKDHSEGLRNRPHTYSITQKARIIITIEGVTESHTSNEIGVTESQSGVTESHGRCDRESHEETIKKQIKKEVPEKLQHDEFIEAWIAWCDYRKERRKKLTDSTKELQLKKLARYSVGEAVAMIEQSIEQGWIGLFDVKDKSRIKSVQDVKKNKDGSLYV